MCICSTTVSRKENLTGISPVQNLHRCKLNDVHFCTFMERNGILYGENGRKRIADNTLVALTLMIAESRTEEKDVMVKVV